MRKADVGSQTADTIKLGFSSCSGRKQKTCQREPAVARLVFNSPHQRKVASSARGRSKRVSAMTNKVITIEFIVPTIVAIVLGIALSICGVYLIDCYLGPIDQAEAHYAVTDSH
jgi:hypothetical protein